MNFEATEKQKKAEESAHENNTKRKQGFQKGQSRPPRKTDRWDGNTSHSFWNWVEDIQPRILTRSGKWEVFNPTDAQRELIEGIFNPKHRMILALWPRRHGKTYLIAIIVLFFFTARKDQNIILMGTTERHTHEVMFKNVLAIARHTPALKNLRLTDKMIYTDYVKDETHNNYIQKLSPTTATAFGQRISLLWCSDMHASPSQEPFDALQASLLDTEGSLCVCDSNIDSIDGPVHAIEKLALEDESIYVHRIEYRDFEDYKAHCPSWIDLDLAERERKRLLEPDFKRDYLGQRSTAVNALFPANAIQLCKDQYMIPVLDIASIAQDREYFISCGLDRARNLLPGPNSDRTVLTCTMKLVNPVDAWPWEPSFWILDERRFLINSGREIKKAIIEINDRYKIDNIVLEAFEIVDLIGFLAEEKIPYETVSASSQIQNSAMPELHRIVKEGRLHIPANCQNLISEMESFTYHASKPGQYVFGSGRFHDDHCYALCWSIWGSRLINLNTFSLDNIICTNKTYKRELCFLMRNEDGIKLNCADSCRAFRQVEEMFLSFKRFNLDSELNLADFYHAFVKVTGAVQFQGV